MLYMNDSDMVQAETMARTYEMKLACRFLIAFKDEVDQHSDGWAYWRAPLKAATRLMKLIQQNGSMSDSEFQWALTPIKSFYTRKGTAAGMRFPVVD